jgi:cob(I)alamin adenosyltransferase
MRGLIYAFTGEGKGKTSAALGVATRALLLGKQVVWVAFYKQASWGLAEAKLPEKFENLEMYLGGRGFKIQDARFKKGEIKVAPVGSTGNVVVDTASEVEHVAAAKKCLALATAKLQGSELCKSPFLLILDEILNAVSDGLVEVEAVQELLSQRGMTHVVLTGRAETETAKSLLVGADLVTECRKVQHPYDAGKLAVAGLDF